MCSGQTGPSVNLDGFKEGNVIFLGKDNSELKNGFLDNISSPPWIADYKLGKLILLDDTTI